LENTQEGTRNVTRM